MARVRLNGQKSPHSTRSLLDGNRTQSQAVELIPSEPAGKTKALAVVVNHENNATVVLRQFYHDMGSLSMLFYIVECFTVNLENLAADAVRSVQFRRINQQIHGQTGFIPVALPESSHQIHHVRGLHPQWPQVGNHVPQLSSLVA